MIQTTKANSGIASFFTGLLSECSSKHDIKLDELSVHIVVDRANSEIPTQRINRSRSFVVMQRQRSSRQLSRWSNEFRARDSDPVPLLSRRRRTPEQDANPRNELSGGKNADFDRRGMLRKTRSDTNLLKPPVRTASPRITKNTKGLSRKHLPPEPSFNRFDQA